MGGVIVRYFLHKHRPENLGKVVLIASPSQGNEIASILSNYAAFKKLLGPALVDLTSGSKLLEELNFKVDYELGIIAGNLSLNPLTSFLIFNGDNDGTVSLASTKVKGMKDYHVINYSHYFMTRNNVIVPYIVDFLRYGKFNKKADLLYSNN
jgi:hypothetical protein